MADKTSLLCVYWNESNSLYTDESHPAVTQKHITYLNSDWPRFKAVPKNVIGQLLHAYYILLAKAQNFSSCKLISLIRYQSNIKSMKTYYVTH